MQGYIYIGAICTGRPVHFLIFIMKFLRLAQALAAGTALAVTPAMAQVSSSLLGTTAGTGVLGSGLGALRNGGSAITTYIDPTDPTKGVSSQTTGTASGGKVGTFTFSGSEGTSQNFSVGTSTNLGVNASASSTSEYAVTSTAALAVGGSSLRQTIGTSGIQESATAREQQRTSYVEDTVSRTVGSTTSDYFSKATEDSKTLTSSQMTDKYSWWNATTMSGKSASEIETSAVSESGKSSSTLFADAKFKTSQQASNDYSASTASSEAANGVISGSFRAASTSTGSTATTGSQTNGSSTDNNEVTVKGIGNAATLNANGGSEFRTNVVARSGNPTSNSATANGGAGASMSSTSTANASNTSFSSVFIQSF